MRIPRSLILAGMIAAGGALGWVINAYSEQVGEFLLAASEPADPPAGQAAEAPAGETVVRVIVITPDAAAPPAAEPAERSAAGGGAARSVAVSMESVSMESVSMESVSGGAADAAGVPAPAWQVEPQPAPAAQFSNDTYLTVHQVSLSAAGEHIVIANDRSIVLAGDDGRLNANAGDVASSGALAIDTQDSTLETGDATTVPAQPGDASAPVALPLAGAGTTAAAAGWSAPGASVGDRGPGRATSISGWEDHSLFVHGSDHVVTYDDSNVFIDRDGNLNMNTGDTDSSGLNVVDATRSTVVTGRHIEDGEEDGDEDGEEEEEEEEGEEEEDASGTVALTTPTSGASVADEGDAVATGRDAFVVGADGIDDLAVDVLGQRNVVTYDDSNVAVGGTGDVNAQIGDSDTSGAVVMGVTDSVIASGNST